MWQAVKVSLMRMPIAQEINVSTDPAQMVQHPSRYGL